MLVFPKILRTYQMNDPNGESEDVPNKLNDFYQVI